MPLPTTTLAELVGRWHDCLHELLGLVRQQQELAERGDMDALLVVLNRKQPYLEALPRSARALDPCRGEDPESRVWADPALRTHCQRQWQACDEMRAELMKREQASEATLRGRRDSIGLALGK